MAFDNLTILSGGDIVLSEDFSAGEPEWETAAADVRDGWLMRNSTGALAYLSDDSWHDFGVEVDVIADLQTGSLRSTLSLQLGSTRLGEATTLLRLDFIRQDVVLSYGFQCLRECTPCL